MGIRKSIGLGIGIIVLRVLTPVIFDSIQETAVAFLKGATVSATVATQVAGSLEPQLPHR